MEILEFFFPGIQGVRCVFTLRGGGNSKGIFASANLGYSTGDDHQTVRANREALRRQCGFSVWQELHQVHGAVLRTELEGDFLDAPLLDGDGLCATKAGHALVIKTADCQPILLTDHTGAHIAALHCGWRGNRAGFPEKAVREFCQRYALSPENVFAVRGPSLGPGRSEFIHFEREWGAEFLPWFNADQKTVDLWSLTRAQLQRAGLPPQHIFGVDLCTASSPQFFSYRRDGRTGRQAGIIWREEQR